MELGEAEVGDGDSAEARQQHEADDDVAHDRDRAEELQRDKDDGGAAGRRGARQVAAEAVAPSDDPECGHRDADDPPEEADGDEDGG